MPDATIKVEYRVDGCKVYIMATAMFHTSICTILLVVIHSSKNTAEKVDNFAIKKFSSARWQTTFKFNNTVNGRKGQ